MNTITKKELLQKAREEDLEYLIEQICESASETFHLAVAGLDNEDELGECQSDYCDIILDRICDAIESNKRKALREIEQMNTEPCEIELLDF